MARSGLVKLASGVTVSAAVTTVVSVATISDASHLLPVAIANVAWLQTAP